MPKVTKHQIAQALDTLREHYIKTQDRPMRGSGRGHLTPAGAVYQLPADFAYEFSQVLTKILEDSDA